MIRTWKITKDKPEVIDLPDLSSLDAITRQLPDGYYTTFRTHAGCTRVLGLKSHLDRLPGVNALLLRRQLLALLEPFCPNEARVRVMQTMQGQIYIAIESLKLPPREVYENGVHVETTEIQRNSPRLKTTTFIGQSDAERKHLANIGVFEALLVKNGRILEGMTSNFFYVISRATERASGLRRRRAKSEDDAYFQESASSPFVAANVPHSAQREVLYTAQRDVLLGVTRRNVIRVAHKLKIEMRYEPLKVNRISAVNEAFITSSSRGIVPVVQIDDVVIGEGRLGPVTKQLSVAYEAYVIQRAEKI